MLAAHVARAAHLSPEREGRMEQKSADRLQEHMLWTYYGLRYALAIIGIGLPVILWLAGRILHDTPLEPSISRYYHTDNGFDAFATRDIFVGGLIAAAFCLYLYKGYSDKENNALNAAAVFALFVAMLPSAPPDTSATGISTLHLVAAVAFFACIAYVSIFRSKDTLELLEDPALQAKFRWAYRWTGNLMWVLPVAAMLAYLGRDRFAGYPVVFWLEGLGLWAFGAYWVVKTIEMRESQAEKATLEGELERVAEETGPRRLDAPKATPKAKVVEKIVKKRA